MAEKADWYEGFRKLDLTISDVKEIIEEKNAHMILAKWEMKRTVTNARKNISGICRTCTLFRVL